MNVGNKGEVRRAVQGCLQCHSGIDGAGPAPAAADRIPGRGAQAGLPEAQSGAHQRWTGGGQGLGICELRLASPEFNVIKPQGRHSQVNRRAYFPWLGFFSAVGFMGTPDPPCGGLAGSRLLVPG